MVHIDASIILTLIGMFVAWSLGLAGLVWWLSSQFSSVRSLFYAALEAHEKELTGRIDRGEERTANNFRNHESRIRSLEFGKVYIAPETE